MSLPRAKPEHNPARVDSQNGCHHFQWWFRTPIGTTPARAHPDSAPLEAVAPVKGCRSRVVQCSRYALGAGVVAVEGEVAADGDVAAEGKARAQPRPSRQPKWVPPLLVVVPRTHRHAAGSRAPRLRTDPTCPPREIHYLRVPSAPFAPSSSAMRSSWLYFALRSLRHGAPVLIWPQFVATAMSAIVESSVSPERCERIAR